eukprot:CAMPEP_0181216254 /NCGR_PEP_ID=MMETSP1096-20121128/26481_1 /TAXON_ID=156174 ORGANISM="Chrysochromulina ericina, Strain CCMP281" /NCGR_SAMPLE_ID=MMETSP1096 /ASSEMBLY_ACC=CAM_ASM_000453 /LENGTH=673 /DNA_ID=CAMNT_0023308229 /DNA_START=18 /DNA_END=2040 /DNA_ORIENTATION=-
MPQGLTPLQLATYLGFKTQVRKLLKRHMRPLWKWGPETCNHLFLDELDSVGAGGTQLMELICCLDARIETQELLLSDFVNGALFNLFLVKWKRTGFRMHVLQLGLQFLHLFSLLQVSFCKPNYESVQAWSVWMSTVVVLVLIEEELREIVLWIYAQGWKAMRRETYRVLFMERLRCALISKCIMWCTSLAASGLILTWNDERFNPGVTGIGGILPQHIAEDATWRNVSVPILLALSTLIACNMIIQEFFVIWQQTGVYILVVNQMLGSDVLLVLAVLIPYLFAFSCAMWPVFPTYKLFAHDSPFAFISLVWSLLMMIFTGGTTIRLGPQVADMADLTTPDLNLIYHEWGLAQKMFGDMLFVGLYFGFVILSVVLLLNVLIASMSGTYEEAMANATRNWRWAFARRVLRMVMLAGYDRPVGTLDTIRDWGGKKRYYVEVLSVKKNIEGGTYEGTTDFGADGKSAGSDEAAAAAERASAQLDALQKQVADILQQQQAFQQQQQQLLSQLPQLLSGAQAASQTLARVSEVAPAPAQAFSGDRTVLPPISHPPGEAPTKISSAEIPMQWQPPQQQPHLYPLDPRLAPKGSRRMAHAPSMPNCGVAAPRSARSRQDVYTRRSVVWREAQPLPPSPGPHAMLATPTLHGFPSRDVLQHSLRSGTARQADHSLRGPIPGA